MRSHRPSLADVAREMGVRDERLLEAIGEVPRATFVPQDSSTWPTRTCPSRSGMCRSRPNRPSSRAWWRRCACGEPRSCSKWEAATATRRRCWPVCRATYGELNGGPTSPPRLSRTSGPRDHERLDRRRGRHRGACGPRPLRRRRGVCRLPSSPGPSRRPAGRRWSPRAAHRACRCGSGHVIREGPVRPSRGGGSTHSGTLRPPPRRPRLSDRRDPRAVTRRAPPRPGVGPPPTAGLESATSQLWAWPPEREVREGLLALAGPGPVQSDRLPRP